MLFIFSTPVLIRHLWQLMTVVFMHWCLICAVLLGYFWKLIVFFWKDEVAQITGTFWATFYRNKFLTFSLKLAVSMWFYGLWVVWCKYYCIFLLGNCFGYFFNLGIFFISSGHTAKRKNKLECLSLSSLSSLVEYLWVRPGEYPRRCSTRVGSNSQEA
jgi:hypothetical protein